MTYKSILELGKNIVDRLDYFENLGDRWCGENSISPDSVITSNVLHFIYSLPIEYILKLDIFDDLTANILGGIGIDFYLNEKSFLSLEVGVSYCNYILTIDDRFICGQDNLRIDEESTLEIIEDKLKVLYS